MLNAWDSDKKLFVIVLVAATISLAVTYKSVLAQSADGMIKKIEGALKQVTGQSPSESKKPSRATDQRRGFHPQHIMCCEPTRFGVVVPRGSGYVVYPCRGIRTCRP